MNQSDYNPQYWQKYSNLQYVKHELIRNYLNGWLPKLGRWSGRMVYLDTHAGRGKYNTGHYGSPLVALETVLKHKSRERLFGSCEIVFLFIEKDYDNCSALRNEIAALGKLPNNIKTEIVCDECYEACLSIITDLKDKNQRLAPSFIFVDPYGFKVPFSVLRELMTFNRVELFINIIWRELSMAISRATKKDGMASTLDYIFDGDAWRELIGLEFEEQSLRCIELLQKLIGARWATYIRMLGRNNVTRYILMHLSNHDAGRELMKDCIWKVCPQGGFYARQGEVYNQELLITPEPDLSNLRQWVINLLQSGPKRWSTLDNLVRHELWRSKHLNDVVRSLRKDGVIEGRNYDGRFTPSNDPELYLPGGEQ